MRIASLLVLLFSLSLPVGGSQGDGFDRNFHDATLRVDFFHVGNAYDELITYDRLIRQGPWAGSRTHLGDPFGLGRYVFRMRAHPSGELLFEKGFDSYFGEYRTTGVAADGERRTFHESILAPCPRGTARVQIGVRRPDGEINVLAEKVVDPNSVEVADEPPAGGSTVVEAHHGGHPHTTLDVAIIGEGYTSSDEGLFRQDLARFAEVLLDHEPFATHRDRISVRGVLHLSIGRGCDEPTRRRARRTAVQSSFNSLGSQRYLLTEDNRALRDVAANVPYDAIVIMVNHDRYGGGGIYNAFCTFTAHNQWAEYLLLHEFGHSFAGLADEYYSSDVAYQYFYPTGHEPAEANITTMMDPGALKWADLVAPGTPLPTPWEKEVFDQMSGEYGEQRGKLNDRIADAAKAGAPDEEIARLELEQEELAKRHSTEVKRHLGADRRAGQVGAFEGAGYMSTGMYRPMLDCLMFSKGVQPFCRVCERAVDRMVRQYIE